MNPENPENKDIGFEHLGESLQGSIIHAEIEGGADVNKLAQGKTLEISTASGKTYLLERREDGLYISGNPKYFPGPTKVISIGSILLSGGSSIMNEQVIRGGRLELLIEGHKDPILSTAVVEVKEQ